MTPKDLKDFESYSRSMGISSMTLDYYKQRQTHFEGVKSSLTPYILEERSMNVTVMDVFSRLMMERILWVAGEVNDHMSTIVQAQLKFLESLDNNVITMHIDSPGGSVKSGLSMVNVMKVVKPKIKTVNTGMAASMGSVLLGAGSKGLRAALEDSETMLHQSSGGAVGNIQDAEITMKQWRKVNERLFFLLGKFCNKPSEQVMADATRDLWLSADEAKDYGIIDEVIYMDLSEYE